jgi:hypothetical protein
MSNETIILFAFRLLLVVVGVWCILNEKKLIKIERKIFRTIKRMVKK